MVSQAHNFLKERARKWLLINGFSVKYEYFVKYKGKRMLVDVVGFKGDTSIAIECGRTPRRKIEMLKEIFTEVKRFPYTYAICPRIFRQDRHSTRLYKRGKVQVPQKVIAVLNLTPGESTIVWVQERGRIYIESGFQEGI